MPQTAKIFTNGNSQAVRLPLTYRFTNCTEVFIHRDPDTQDVILSKRPQTWDSFFTALQDTEIPSDFLRTTTSHPIKPQDRDPFIEWQE